MKRTCALLLAAAALAPPARAADKSFWGMVATEAALEGIDTGTTIQGQHIGLREENPFLGPHPSPAKVSIYMAATAVAWDALAYRVNRHHPRLARTLLSLSIGGEGLCDINNAHALVAQASPPKPKTITIRPKPIRK